VNPESTARLRDFWDTLRLEEAGIPLIVIPNEFGKDDVIGTVVGFVQGALDATPTANIEVVFADWAASTNATAYAVCLDSVVNNTCDGTWNQFTNVLAVNAINLIAGTTYEWQVRSSNANGTVLADGGTSFTFLDQAALPAAFNKATPATGSTAVATTPTLAWNASTGAVSYEYCIDTTNDNACTAPAVWTTTGTLRTAPLTGLANSTTYYWQARARNTSGTTDANTGTWWSFTTAAPAVPGAFTKSAPANAAVNVAVAPTLSWAASASSLSYEYCIDTTNNSTCDSGIWTTTGTARTAALTGLA